MRVQIMELESMADLLLVTKHFVFKMNFADMNVYYSGVTSDNFVGLNVFITKDDYSGILKTSSDGKNIENRDAIDSQTTSVISVTSDTLVRPILANYIINKFGITKKMLQSVSDFASNVIYDKMSNLNEEEVIEE